MGEFRMTLTPDDLKLLTDAYAWGNDAISAMRVYLTRIDALIKAQIQQPTYVIYSQRDPSWSSIGLGTGQSTIGQDGCLMTCAAQMLTECGSVMNPAALNVWLKANGGFVQGDHFVFASIDRLNVVKFRTLGACVNVPAPMQMLEAAITAGAYVIVQVDFIPGGSIQQHWVMYRGQGNITDPWYGDKALITRYGKDAATAIIGYAIYDKVTL